MCFPQANTWQHVAFMWTADKQYMVVYVGGVEQERVEGTAKSRTSTTFNNYYLGRPNNNNNEKYMDEVYRKNVMPLYLLIF